MLRKMGKNQESLLYYLVEYRRWYGGTWGCGWNWGTQANTAKLLDTLVKRGLASVTDGEYRPTDAGKAHVEAAKASRKPYSADAHISIDEPIPTKERL